jgi:hypothetical protein
VICAPDQYDRKRFDVTILSSALPQCPDATPDDNLIDTDAFACAMAYFADRPGVLHVPVGRYLIDKEIRVPARSQIVGDGFGSVLFQVKGDWKQAPLVSLEDLMDFLWVTRAEARA